MVALESGFDGVDDEGLLGFRWVADEQGVDTSRIGLRFGGREGSVTSWFWTVVLGFLGEGFREAAICTTIELRSDIVPCRASREFC